MARFLITHSSILFLVLVFACVIVSVIKTPPNQLVSIRRNSTPMATEILGVKIEKNPPHSKLSQLQVTTWPKWGCSPSKFPWTFTATETMYLLEGKVKVYVDAHEEFFEIGAGDLVVFPKGMKVTWDVIEAVKKHYSLEK